MTTQQKIQIQKDLPNKKITVIRQFDASPEEVWKAWTESELLDQWWAPKPWKAETKSMDFSEGGQWLYAMVGPDGERHWAIVNYMTIEPITSFTAQDSFSDENGNKSDELPSMHWKNSFRATPTGTEVLVEITFDSIADLEKIVEMGFEEGFTAGLSNLEELFSVEHKA